MINFLKVIAVHRRKKKFLSSLVHLDSLLDDASRQFQREQFNEKLFYEMLDNVFLDESSSLKSCSDNTVQFLKTEQLESKSWLERWSKKKEEPVYAACIQFFKNTGKFSKNDLYLIKKLKLLSIVNPARIKIKDSKPFSYKFANLFLCLNGMAIGGWSLTLLVTGLYETIDLTLIWCLGICTGVSVRYFWDRSYGYDELVDKITNVAPWMSTIR